MFAATREFIDDTCVHKSVQKSKNDKLPSSQKSRLRLTINEDNKKLAVVRLYVCVACTHEMEHGSSAAARRRCEAPKTRRIVARASCTRENTNS